MGSGSETSLLTHMTVNKVCWSSV